MCSFRLLWGICVTAVLVNPAAADLPARVSGFTQELNPSLKVAGRYLAGFMIPTEGMTPDPDLVSVWLDGRHETLCVSARTVDGYYESTAEFEIAATPPGVYILELSLENPGDDSEEQKEEVFSSYGVEELVLRGRVGPDCNNPAKLFEVPMTWGCVRPGEGCENPGSLVRKATDNEGQQELLTYWVYLNSDGMEVEIVIPGSDNPNEAAVIPCSDVDTGRKQRTYDKKCVITYRDGFDESRARIDFFYDGETQAPEKLSVLFLGRD